MYAFVPKNGAPIDVQSIQAVADIPQTLLESYLKLRWGEEHNGVVLSGLEPNGKRPKKNGPPGAMQFSISNFVLSSGVAIVPIDSKPVLVRCEDPQMLQLEEPEKSQQKRAIVLKLSVQSQNKSGKSLAHVKVSPMVLVVDQDTVDEENMTVLANELAPNIWSTDVCRMVNKEHPLVSTLMELFDTLEDKIWEADMHGQPWQVQRLGREWKTYQSKASVCVTAARIALSMKPTVTSERVRILTNLHWQLQRSVEQAAQALSNWVGVLEAADQYSPVFSAPPVEWDEM